MPCVLNSANEEAVARFLAGMPDLPKRPDGGEDAWIVNGKTALYGIRV
jgi:hypothetical protein